MKTSDFYYDLPSRLIAQTPAPARDGARMLVLNRVSGAVEHKNFRDLPGFCKPGDCLVLNNSRVIPARLLGTRESGGAAELFLLRPYGNDVWEVLARPARRLLPGTCVRFASGLSAEILTAGEEGLRTARFMYKGNWDDLLEAVGRTPLPPYIKTELQEKERYQTVYAAENGSAAAPTAGLHFTPDIFARLSEQGVDCVFCTLHVGLGTFRPVQVADADAHRMHSEWFQLDENAAQRINAARANGGRIIAVGTTACRVLETAADERGILHAMHGDTDIFIRPGYRFRAVDGLFTNFHLPESTLLMLVSAFAGRDAVLRAYRDAVAQEYRFFSFGDCMLIL